MWRKDKKRFKRKTKQTKNGLRCRSHPGYQVKAPPQTTKAYPTGCPFCIALWEKHCEEAPEVEVLEVVEVEVVDDDNGNHLFKPGPEHPNWKQKVDPNDPIWEIVRKYTKGGESLVNRLCKIAQIHPTPTLQCKGVSYKDQLAAMKFLKDMGWGPSQDPDSDKVAGVNIYIGVMGEGTHVEYKQQFVKQIEGQQNG